MKSIDEIIQSMTPAERKQFKDLIEETRSRASQIEQTKTQSMDALRRLVHAQKTLTENLYQIASNLQKLKANLEKVHAVQRQQKPAESLSTEPNPQKRKTARFPKMFVIPNTRKYVLN